MRTVYLFAVLLVFWLALSGHYTAFLIGAGVFSCALVVYLARRKGVFEVKGGHPVHPLLTGAITYWPWLFGQIVLANIDVFWRVWHPRLPIDPRLVRVPYRTTTDLHTTLYANSITLTPGTITLAVEEGEFLVHALSAASEKGLVSGQMHDRVRSLE
ncbi:MAG: Na+/H+ antiporter subunit E [Planctomycetes bacterium]|nr:Na+/H+ antiporter subunit E [Planctomycetota bacterium]